MIAVDTNILIYAHREEFPLHAAALARLKALANGPVPWGVPIFCLGEFVRVVTHRRVLTPPSSLEQAAAFVDALFTSASFRLLVPDDGYWPELRSIVLGAKAAGNLAFDAQIAALCLRSGAALLTADRDFASLGITTTSL
jgi:toxin-antitoxin system PIN domain toxin